MELANEGTSGCLHILALNIFLPIPKIGKLDIPGLLSEPQNHNQFRQGDKLQTIKVKDCNKEIGQHESCGHCHLGTKDFSYYL